MKYWEILADELSASVWSWGCSSQVDSTGRCFHGPTRTVSNNDESFPLFRKLTAFIELQRVTHDDGHRNQTIWPRILACSIACLPDERHITGFRSGTAIVDTDRVRAGHLDVHRVGEVDEHDVDSRYASESTGDGRAAR